MNKRAVIYARVNTDEKTEKGHSLPFQLEECRKYASRAGFQVVREIVDNTSGASLDRPGFIALEAMLSNCEAEAVIAYTSDRLSRNYYDYVPLIGKWQDENIELHFVDRGQPQNDLQEMISDGVFAMLAHSERLKILERTKHGRIKKVKDDKKPFMTGQVSYGYGRIGKSREAEMGMLFADLINGISLSTSEQVQVLGTELYQEMQEFLRSPCTQLTSQNQPDQTAGHF